MHSCLHNVHNVLSGTSPPMVEQTFDHYPLFVGLTREPMIFGVPQNFFITNVCVIATIMIGTHYVILPTLSFIFLHLVAIIGYRCDERFFNILLGTWAFHCPNRNFWGCRTYDPS